jgi:hypothetical protein
MNTKQTTQTVVTSTCNDCLLQLRAHNIFRLITTTTPNKTTAYHSREEFDANEAEREVILRVRRSRDELDAKEDNNLDAPQHNGHEDGSMSDSDSDWEEEKGR